MQTPISDRITSLGERFAFLHELNKEGLPLMVQEALLLVGTQEAPGSANNKTILAWAKTTGLKDYTEDSIPWCGLFMAYIASKAGKSIPTAPLWALNWGKWGEPAAIPGLGDVLVFERRNKAGKPIGGHVGLYIAENDTHYYVLGGNTDDGVRIGYCSKSRLKAARNMYNVPPKTAGRVTHLSSSKTTTSKLT